MLGFVLIFEKMQVLALGSLANSINRTSDSDSGYSITSIPHKFDGLAEYFVDFTRRIALVSETKLPSESTRTDLIS